MENLYIEPFRCSPKVFGDDRGTFSPLDITNQFPDFKLIQCNTVTSKTPYTFRGMHWQEPPYAQTKIIRCLFGEIIDFVVDIRVGSPNYGRTYAFDLKDKNDWVYIPKGFAHAYLTLPHNMGETYPTMVEYLVDCGYHPEAEGGIFMTKDVHDIISREVPMGIEINMNDRDLKWPTIDEIKSNFKYEPDEQ